MITRLLLAALLAWFASPCVILAQCIPHARFPRTETFSTIKVIEGQGPAGSELRLEEQGDRVVATLHDYVGSGSPFETKLQGVLEESKTAGATHVVCKVRLSGKDKRGEVGIDGEITVVYFQGTVTRHIGTEVFSYKISLKRQLPQDNYPVGFVLDHPALIIRTMTGGY